MIMRGMAHELLVNFQFAECKTRGLRHGRVASAKVVDRAISDLIISTCRLTPASTYHMTAINMISLLSFIIIVICYIQLCNSFVIFVPRHIQKSSHVTTSTIESESRDDDSKEYEWDGIVIDGAHDSEFEDNDPTDALMPSNGIALIPSGEYPRFSGSERTVSLPLKLELLWKKSKTAIRLFLFVLLFAGLAVSMADRMVLSDSLLSMVKDKYGGRAKKRLTKWQDFILKNQNKDEMKKLRLVNRYFNAIPYYTDERLWKKNDYWATPVEMLVNYGGDCEDYSIAKYFTLREMGVEEDRLRIMYVKASRSRGGRSRIGSGLNANQAHVVLGYYPSPTSQPLILDNLTGRIKPASERKDLKPVYSYNAKLLWKAISRSRGSRVKYTDDIKQWYELMLKVS